MELVDPFQRTDTRNYFSIFGLYHQEVFEFIFYFSIVVAQLDANKAVVWAIREPPIRPNCVTTISNCAVDGVWANGGVLFPVQAHEVISFG